MIRLLTKKEKEDLGVSEQLAGQRSIANNTLVCFFCQKQVKCKEAIWAKNFYKDDYFYFLMVCSEECLNLYTLKVINVHEANL